MNAVAEQRERHDRLGRARLDDQERDQDHRAQDTLRGIASGEVDTVFRRQRRPTVKACGTLHTPIGSFKTDVRKLKGLGLAISHSPGYELSPRGCALLSRL